MLFLLFIIQCANSTSAQQTANGSQYDLYDVVYIGIPTEHRVLEARTSYDFCGAKRLQFEVPTFCCMKGKTTLATSAIPHELHDLFTRQDVLGRHFKNTIRAYNTNFLFATMGVKLDTSLSNLRSGVYTFRAKGTIYHTIDQLIPRDGQASYLQLYFYEGEVEVLQRLHNRPNLDRIVVETLTRVLAANPYVKTLKHLSKLGPLENYVLSFNQSVELDQRVYNQPRTSEVCHYD